eukprot:m.64042 g.64042  ORF g.64042 m.64042 type:complete len:650 (+) comp8098_c0_seq1:376-2325(+)
MADEKKQREALQKLAKAAKSGNTKKIISAADKVLALLPDDADAVKCKVVALISSGKGKKAVECIKQSAHRDGLQYEHAYALFKAQRYKESYNIAATLGDSFPVRELLAQLHYRLEHFDKSITIYKDLIKQEKTMERQTNVTACYAAAVTQENSFNVPKAVLKRKVEGFENSYNKACIAIAQSKFGDAVDLIKEAADEFITMLKEDEPDIADEEIEQELAILRVQEGVARHRMGDETKAQTLYNTAIKSAPENVGIVAVASNNLIAINGDKDVFNSKHRIKALNIKGIEQNLSMKQLQSAAFNKCLLQLFSNDIAKCRETCAHLRTKYPESKTPDLIEAFSYLKERKVKNKAERLQAISNENSNNEVYALVLAQEYSTKGDFSRTLTSLLRSGTLAYEPSYVGYIIALCNRLGCPDKASSHIEQAIRFYKSSQQFAGSGEILRLLLQLQGDYKLQQEMYTDAVSIFKELVDGDPEDQEANAALIVAMAHVDIDAAEQLSASIPPLELEGDDVDVDELELAKKIRTQKAGIDIDRLTSTATKSSTVEKKKAKRKRPGKKPKVMKPGGPDPNRWLPKWQREANKKGSNKGDKNKRGKKGAPVGSGTQGSSDISEAEMKRLDAANRKPKPSSSSSASKKSNGKKSAGKRKKRK